MLRGIHVCRKCRPCRKVEVKTAESRQPQTTVDETCTCYTLSLKYGLTLALTQFSVRWYHTMINMSAHLVQRVNRSTPNSGCAYCTFCVCAFWVFFI